MFIAQIYDGAVEIADMECVELVRRAEATADLSGYTMMTLGDSLSEGGYWQDYVKEYT